MRLKRRDDHANDLLHEPWRNRPDVLGFQQVEQTADGADHYLNHGHVMQQRTHHQLSTPANSHFVYNNEMEAANIDRHTAAGLGPFA